MRTISSSKGKQVSALVFLLMISSTLGVWSTQSPYDTRTSETTLLAESGQTQLGSRSGEDYDLGIDSIGVEEDSDYWNLVEALIPKDITVTVTNYGQESVNHVVVNLKIKNIEGKVQYNNTFDSRAFPEGHPTYTEGLDTDESLTFTFNKTNDAYQREYDDRDVNRARHSIFILSGLSYIQAGIVFEEDQNPDNDYLRKDVEVAKWIENAELPENESGQSVWFGDTDDNGADSLDHVNMHRAYDFDHDADGCEWARDCTGGTSNTTAAFTGDYAVGTFNSYGWFKEGADPDDCDWDEFGDDDCPKFTTEPNQDDYVMSPPLDLSGMEDLTLGFVYRGNLDEGDVVRIQISKDGGASWTNLEWNATSDNTDWDWEAKDIEISANYYGSDDTDSVRIRIQQDSDDDAITECGGAPCSMFFIDSIMLKGKEKVTRDLAVTDITVRSESFRVHSQEYSSDREINATVLNAGTAWWSDTPVKFTVTDLQGEDWSSYLSDDMIWLSTLAGESSYGNVDDGGHEDQTELFVKFNTPAANTYYLRVEVLAPAGKDFFPDNNTMTVMFRIFDTFFYDNVDDGEYTYTQFHRNGTSNEFHDVDVSDDSSLGFAQSGTLVWRYFEASTDAYDAGADDSMVTPDTCTRNIDGDDVTDVCVDLRAAFKPLLRFSIKWDFAADDRMEVRATTDFNSGNGSFGTWTVLKTYEGTSGDWANSDWIEEEINLEGFEGYQTWIDFRVVSNVGGGRGVLLDDVMVIGNEYENNLGIVEVNTPEYAVLGEEYDLEIVVQSMGLNPQEDVYVYAQILADDGTRVWPSDQSWNYYQIQTTLDKGDTFTVNPGSAGSSWRWGDDLEFGNYILHVEVWRDGEASVPDENPTRNTYEHFIEYVDEPSANLPPTATIDSISPSPARFDAEVTFSGSGSDSDGTVVAYEWTSSRDGFLSDEVDFSITGLSVGNHTIHFRVQDNDGDWSSSNNTGAITTLGIYPNLLPTALIDSVVPSSVRFDAEVTFNGTGSDSDGTVVAYEWHSSQDGFLSDEEDFSITGFSVGNHTIHFRVQDNDGEWSSWSTAELDVYPNAPPAGTIDSIEPSSAEEGTNVSFSGTGSDSDGTIVAYLWESTIDGEIGTDEDFSSSSLSLGHHDITFLVQDNDGMWSSLQGSDENGSFPGVSGLWIYAVPMAIAGSDTAVEPGDSVQFSGAGTDEDGSIAKYEWDFDGDGVYEWSSSENGLSTYIYNNEGTVTAVLRVTDNDGFTATDSRVITVSKPGGGGSGDDDGGGIPAPSLAAAVAAVAVIALHRPRKP